MAILCILFNKLKNYVGEINVESSKSISRGQYEEARKIAWTIRLAAKYTLWQSKYLVKSLTAQYFLI